MNINFEKERVLITGGRSPVALNLARMFHRLGAAVFVAESEPFHLAKKSNAVIGNIHVPQPNKDYEGYIQSIRTYCQQHNIIRIIPTCEEIFHIAKAKETFEKQNISVFCDTIETLHMLHNKFSFFNLLKSEGFTYINTYQFTSQESLIHFLEQTSTKFVLKASYSRFALNVYVIQDEKDVPKLQISTERPWILQDFIEGQQYCSYSVAVNGELVAHTCYPTKYTAGIGANVFFQHIDEPKIEQFVRQLVKKLTFTGQIAFDFIRGEDGEFYPLECNPRATSGLHLFDDVEDFSAVFIEQSATYTRYPTGQLTCKLGLPMLLYGVKNGYMFKETKRFKKDFKQSQDVIYERGDVVPYMYQAVYMLALLLRQLKTRKSLTELTTIDIEWGGK